MNITWEAKKYAADFSFVPKYGQGLIDLIAAPAGSRVLDLGCGNGTLTQLLSDKGYRVTGLDSSTEQIALARQTYSGIVFQEGDATCFTLPDKVDAVFSNAVFHWIDKDRQPALLRCIASALKEHGELVCEMGGYGNNALIHQALQQEFARHGLAYRLPFYFPGIAEYATLMEQAGLQVRLALLFDRSTELKGEDGLYDWIRMFVRVPFAGLPEDLTEQIIRAAVSSLEGTLYQHGKWYADYVRLRMRAVKTSV